MRLEFIDNNTVIDRAARKRIRSHAAMGRNAGKTLVRPSRKKLFGPGVSTTTAFIPIPKVQVEGHQSESSEDAVPGIERQVDDGLCFPVQLAPGSRSLVRRVFSFISGLRYGPGLSNALDSTRLASIWVQYMLLDEAYFHCAMATSITILNSLVSKQENATEAMHHLSRTFRLINERLSGNDAISDTTIAAIAGMAKYERHEGQYRQGLIHIKGLQRIAGLRGGISQLTRHSPSLTQKIFRIDLEYSIYLGSATVFSVEDVEFRNTATFGLRHSFRRQDDEKLPRGPNSPTLFKQLHVDLQGLLRDITGLASLLNDAGAGHRPKLNGYELEDTLLVLGYRLVSICPLGGLRPTSRLDNAVHLGLTAFMVTFLPRLDCRIADNPLLSNLARSAVQEHFGDERENQEVLLWILFIGGASVFKQSDETWLIPKAIRTLRALGLHAWEGVYETLAKFPWVDALHNKAGQALWRRSTSCHRPLAGVLQNDPVVQSSVDSHSHIPVNLEVDDK